MTKARNLARLASVNTSIVGNTIFLSGNVSLANATLSLGANTINSTSLTSTGVVANSYGNTTAIPVITVDAAGRITNATTSSVSGVTGLSFAPANSTITVSTSTTNFNAVVTSGNSTVQGLLTVIDSVSNTSTLIAGSANSVTTAYLLAANAVSNATAYAATAYSNAVATAASDATTKAGTAYSNATTFATTAAGTAYSNAVSVASSDATTKAGTAYSNATTYAATIAGTAYSNAVATAASDATTKAGTAYSNAVSVAASDATTKAGTAYSNAIAYANTVAYTAAGTAYSNVFNGGTFSGAVVVQANLTANSVRMNGDLQIDGNLTVSGNSVTINVTNLNVDDNMIYLNSNSTVSHPDLGFAGNYNDGSYQHAGLFRDATDGVWKFFHGYTPEPDASAFIDTANTSFALSNLQINYVIGNVTGSANSATYLGGNTASTLRTYSDTIAGTAYSNATTYAATIAGTAYSNAVSVAASDATTKAGTAYSNATTYAATIAGTAYSNATTYAATIAGTAYSNATTYAATIAGTAYSNAVSVAASDATTKAGTAYSNATAFAANASNISSGTLSASRLPATYLTAESDTLATVTGRGSTTNGAITISSGTTDQGLTMTVSDAGWNYIGFSHGATRKAYFGLDGSGNPQWGSDSGTFSITGNYTTIGTSARSPLFYDSDNTAYYTDPNSLSALSTLRVYGGDSSTPTQTIQAGVYPMLDFNSDSADANNRNWRLASVYNSYGHFQILSGTVSGGAATTPRLTLSGLTGHLSVGNVVSASYRLHVSGTGYATDDFRSPIFYDSNDTAYYVDPRSNSTLSGLKLNGIDNDAAGSGSDSILWINKPNNNDWAMIVTGSLEYGIDLRMATSHSYAIRAQANGTEYSRLGSDLFYHNASVRAPIFYDSDNTAYYLNPNSTTSLRTVGSWRSDASTWDGEFSGKIQYHSNHWYIQAADLLIYRNSGGSNVFTVNQSGSAIASADMRSPLFYDSDNTAYYTNPAGASVVSDMRINDGNVQIRAGNVNRNTKWRALDTSTDVGISLYNSADTWCMQLYANAGSEYGFLNGNWAAWDFRKVPSGNLFLNNQSTYYVNGSEVYMNRVYGVTDIRSPIYYDLDDTAYYVNPAGASQLQGHTRFGPYAGHVSSGNVSGVEIRNGGGSGDGDVACISWHCAGYFGMHMHLRHDGYFGIGGWSATSWRWYSNTNNGDMTAAGNVTAYSDPRLKEDVKVIESAIDKIKQLNGVKFRWIESSVIGRPGEYDYGILSTDVEKIAPELVVNSIHEAPEGDFYKTVAYDKLVAFTIEAIKEQQKLIESQEARIAKLEALINKLVS